MPVSTKVRKYTRISLPKGTFVAWEYASERKVSPISVMGLGGLFISTPEPPPVGNYIKLVFEVPGGDVRARALICDSTPGKGMGIQFMTMGQQERARLNKLIASLAKT